MSDKEFKHQIQRDTAVLAFTAELIRLLKKYEKYDVSLFTEHAESEGISIGAYGGEEYSVSFDLESLQKFFSDLRGDAIERLVNLFLGDDDEQR